MMRSSLHTSPFQRIIVNKHGGNLAARAARRSDVPKVERRIARRRKARRALSAHFAHDEGETQRGARGGHARKHAGSITFYARAKTSILHQTPRAQQRERTLNFRAARNVEVELPPPSPPLAPLTRLICVRGLSKHGQSNCASTRVRARTE